MANVPFRSDDGLASGSTDIVQAVSNIVTISSIQVTDSSYTVLDDTAVDLAGGYIKITGLGFASGCQVLINNTPATSTTFVSSTEVRAQVPAMAAGTYVVYLVNVSGSVAIAINGITYSANPAWVTASTLTSQQVDVAISIQLDATDATTYSLQAGSSLPAGVTLTSGGLLSGTVTGVTEDTTYSFTVVATDAENQDSPRTFSVTVTAVTADEYFNSTVLLLNGDGVTGAQNNTFVDSSANALTVTRNGNATQGSFSPFSPTDWSAYFDGNGDYLSLSYNVNLAPSAASDYTAECWVNYTGSASGTFMLFGQNTDADYIWAVRVISGVLYMGTNGSQEVNCGTLPLNAWTHIAMCYDSGGNIIRCFVNGTQVGSRSSPTITNTSTNFMIGSRGTQWHYTGYISNLRIVKGSALYTSNFTPSSTPLTAVSNTQLLTCQTNRFVDNSANAFAITRAGDAKITAFSPFAPTEAWSAATHGGSLYLDGTGDYISIASPTSALVCSGDFTLEFWAYTDLSQAFYFGGQYNDQQAIAGEWLLYSDTNGAGVFYLNGSGNPRITISTTGTFKKNEWQHIAAVRNGTTVTLFVNGVSVGTATKSDAFGRTGTSYDIGSYYTHANFGKGHISGYRLVNGTALYTSNFTPPTTPPTAIANTSLLLNFTNAGIYDATAKNVLETVGNAQVSTSVKKYGTGSMKFDGSGDYLTMPPGRTVSWETGDFTIEGWVYFNSLASESAIMLGKDVGWVLYVYPANKLQWGKVSPQTPANLITGSSTLSTGQWYHIAVTRASNTVKIWLNGQLDGSATDSANYSGTGYLQVGISHSGAYFDGYIDDLRITKGVARYTANFTPPDSEFPTQ